MADGNAESELPPDPLGPAFPEVDWKPVLTWLRDLQKSGATLEEASAIIAAMLRVAHSDTS
jgi:hypothetical protein